MLASLIRPPACAALFMCAGLLAGVAADAPPADEIETDEPGDVTQMAPFGVRADRLETFGFRVGGKLLNPFSSSLPVVMAVVPNTAAAKAGLKPGERILTTDGASAAVTLLSLSKWRKIFAKKAAEIASGKKSVTWILGVESADGKERRTVWMVVPTPPPHWGASKWQPPVGRAPATVEPGPLAERCRVVLDNGIWSNRHFARVLALDDGDAVPFLGYEWTLVTGGGERHRIFVTQQHGRTEVVLDRLEPGKGSDYFVTTPASALEKAAYQPFKGRIVEPPLEEARVKFEKEMNFWLNDVGRVSARWPLEVLKTANPGNNLEENPRLESPTLAMGARAAAFLKLPPATEAQRALFADALGKLGADEDAWAYTETSRGIEDKRVTVVRVDPSQPAARCTLLQLDGKVPTPSQVKQWRDEGRDVSASLGDLPPIRGLVDVEDVRVFKDEAAATVFELPLRGGNPEFPAEKFQALFRVNKTVRGFEDFAVKLRESFRIAGVVSVSEAGLEARFRTLDPALAPQPVYLRAGGAVRVLLVKVARAFESTRSDFQRVTPPAEAAEK